MFSCFLFGHVQQPLLTQIDRKLENAISRLLQYQREHETAEAEEQQVTDKIEHLEQQVADLETSLEAFDRAAPPEASQQLSQILGSHKQDYDRLLSMFVFMLPPSSSHTVHVVQERGGNAGHTSTATTSCSSQAATHC